MAPLCCWVIWGQCSVSSQGWVHIWSPYGIMQGNRAWKSNLKKKIKIDSFHYLNGPKVWLLFIYFFIRVITQQKDRPILCWINLILAVGNSLKWHICKFSQFRPDLIATINFGPQVDLSALFCCPGHQLALGVESLRKTTRVDLSYIVNTVVADGLVVQGVRQLAARLWSYLS